MSSGVHAAAVGVLVLLGAFLAAVAVAMALYPGGTWMDATTVGHSFWGNYLCDLGRAVALDGRPNPAAVWGRTALWLAVLCAGAFWLAVPALFRSTLAAGVVRVSGTLSTAALLLLPFAEGRLHPPVVLLGAVPGFVAALLTVVALRGRRWLASAGAMAILVAAIDLKLYLRFDDPPLAIVPLIQRLATVVALVWMAAGAIAVLRGQDGAGAGAGEVGSSGSPRAT